MFSKCIPRAWTKDATYVLVPSSYSALGNTRNLNQLTEVSLHAHAFQLFIHATKITHFWPLLECSL